MREVVVSTAPTGGDEPLIPFPATHPARHGVLRLRLRCDGDVVVDAEAIPGFMHRGAEALLEVRDHRAGMALANRHDWLAPAVAETAYALAAESLLGMSVPMHATWLRTCLVELTRITAGLVWLAAPVAPGRLPDDVVRSARHVREDLLARIEELTGARMHVTFARVGGVGAAPPRGWLDDVAASMDSAEPVLADLDAALALAGPPPGVAVVGATTAAGHGASGPVGRASGLSVDLRRDAPSLAYADLAPLLPGDDPSWSSNGDAAARVAALMASVRGAVGLVRACLHRLEQLVDEPVAVPLPKVLRFPVGGAYAAVDGPFGVAGVYLESRGDAVPHRVKLRTPAFAHASLLGPALAGTRWQDLADAVASFFLVVGDVDR